MLSPNAWPQIVLENAALLADDAQGFAGDDIVSNLKVEKLFQLANACWYAWLKLLPDIKLLGAPNITDLKVALPPSHWVPSKVKALDFMLTSSMTRPRDSNRLIFFVFTRFTNRLLFKVL